MGEILMQKARLAEMIAQGGTEAAVRGGRSLG